MERKAGMEAIGTDTNLQPAVAHIVAFIHDGIRVNLVLNFVELLYTLISMIRQLVHNHSIDLLPQLHKLLPSTISCCLYSHAGNGKDDDDWMLLREYSAATLALIVQKYSPMLPSIRVRPIAVLVKHFNDTSASLSTLYGALLAILGCVETDEQLSPIRDRFFALMDECEQMGPDHQRYNDAAHLLPALITAKKRFVDPFDAQVEEDIELEPVASQIVE
ncbi:unnamed protein product, partial [Mesorhabditis spiculigera]